MTMLLFMNKEEEWLERRGPDLGWKGGPALARRADATFERSRSSLRSVLSTISIRLRV